MKVVTDRLDRISPGRALAAAGLIVAGVGVVDWLTVDYSVADLYMPACFLAAWCAGVWAGLAITGLCAVAIFWCEHLLGTVHVWNRAIEVVALVVVSLLVSALKRSDAALRDLARQDPLTGLDNRRAFLTRAEVELAVSRRSGHPITIAFLDLDGFKALNDAKGHAEGDRALCAVAAVLRRRTRAADACARLGGDEFALLLRDADGDAAARALGQFQDELRVEMEQHRWSIRASVGAVTLRTFSGTVAEALQAADRLMYQAKRAGTGTLRHESR